MTYADDVAADRGRVATQVAACEPLQCGFKTPRAIIKKARFALFLRFAAAEKLRKSRVAA